MRELFGYYGRIEDLSRMTETTPSSVEPAASLSLTPARTIDPFARRGIAEFLERLSTINLPPVSRIILYGSYARGDFHDESDVDLAVVLVGQPAAGDERFEWVDRLNAARDDVLLATSVNLSPMILWEGELANPKETLRPRFYRNIVSEGVEISRGQFDDAGTAFATKRKTPRRRQIAS